MYDFDDTLIKIIKVFSLVVICTPIAFGSVLLCINTVLAIFEAITNGV
jgi:hypothetical protein